MERRRPTVGRLWESGSVRISIWRRRQPGESVSVLYVRRKSGSLWESRVKPSRSGSYWLQEQEVAVRTPARRAQEVGLDYWRRVRESSPGTTPPNEPLAIGMPLSSHFPATAALNYVVNPWTSLPNNANNLCVPMITHSTSMITFLTISIFLIFII